METPHVHYILLAEFDLVEGSCIRQQYPAAIPNYEPSSLAELMLPEGGHNRTEDWTVFFLNRGGDEQKRKKITQAKHRRPSVPVTTPTTTIDKPVGVIAYTFSTELGDWAPISADDEVQGLLIEDSIEVVVTGSKSGIITTVPIHNLLQYTKLQDQFVSVYKPDGSAVGFYFGAPEDEQAFSKCVEQCLVKLSGESPGPTEMLAEPVLSSLAADESPAPKDAGEKKPFLFCLNLVQTKRIATAKRGAVMKAMALCTQHRFFHVYKPLLVLALDTCFEEGHDPLEMLKYLFETINNLDLRDCPKLSEMQRRVTRLAQNTHPHERGMHEFTSYCDWKNVKIPVRISYTMEEDEVGEASVVELIRLFKDQTMVIFNALLVEKRVLFVGHQKPAGDVCKCVLSACMLVSPPLKGMLKRAFPYAFLTNLDFLELPGYIAGVTNPIFEQRDKWWDVCCDIGTGKVTTRMDDLEPTVPALRPLDAEFIDMLQNGIQAHYSEDWVRGHFRDYTQHIIDMALNEEEFGDEMQRNTHMEQFKLRMKKWSITKSAADYVKYRHDRYVGRAVKDIDIGSHVRKLRVQKKIPEREMIMIYQDFVTFIKTEAELMEFLSYLPWSQGGLYPIAVSLLHSSEAVRLATSALLKRLDSLEDGMKIVSSLNYFLLLAYHRNARALGMELDDDDDCSVVLRRGQSNASDSVLYSPGFKTSNSPRTSSASRPLGHTRTPSGGGMKPSHSRNTSRDGQTYYNPVANLLSNSPQAGSSLDSDT